MSESSWLSRLFGMLLAAFAGAMLAEPLAVA